MGLLKNTLSFLTLAAAVLPIGGAAPSRSGAVAVNLRIEGLTRTIFEGPIISTPRKITTSSGGTHECDGTNNNANPTPGATPTTALDQASKLKGFGYDGTFDAQFDDFFITSIGGDTQTSTQFWGVLVNYDFTPVGGCQFENKKSDEVLWAFDAFNAQHFLKLETSRNLAIKGKSFTVKVTDGKTGQPIEGAKVGGATTGADGTAKVTTSKIGLLELKAEKTGSIRSNKVTVVVA